MSQSPTHADAELILRLYEARREPRLREARAWFTKSFSASTLEEYDRLCPRGSEENASFRMVISYWEMACSFVTTGALNRELLLANGQELLLVWTRIAPLVPPLRERTKNPLFLRHLEEVGKAFVDWYEARAPEFYTQYRQTVASWIRKEEN
jgi:hypothetical protein